MSVTPISDLAQFLQTQSRFARAQTDLQRLTAELSSGEKTDLGTALRGNFSQITSIERGLRITASYSGAADLAAGHFATMQTGLQTIDDQIGNLGPEILSAAGFGQRDQILTSAIGAESAFSLIVTTLNTQIGGRSPFAGVATDQPALISAGDMLDELELLVAGAPDAASMITIVDDYFNDPAGGYETTAFLGDPTPPSGFMIAEGETAGTEVTALDASFRTTFSGLAIAALMTRAAGPNDAASLSELGTAAGERMLSGQSAVITRRAELGVQEARVETALTRHRATETALGLERARLVSADPAKTAAELQSVQAQLDTIYLLTARLSRLSLAEYL